MSSEHRVEIDITEDLQPSTDLNKLTQQCLEVIKVQEQIKVVEDEVKRLKALEESYLSDVLVNTMVGSRVTFISVNGKSVELGDYVDGSIPSKTAIESAKTEEDRQELITRKNKAFAWLRANNFDGLIRNVLSVDIPKGGDKKAAEVLKVVAKLGLACGQDETVHAQTLKAFLKETSKKPDLMARIPKEVFKLQVGQRVKIKAQKDEAK